MYLVGCTPTDPLCYRTCIVGINRNVRNNASKRHQKSSLWELTLTVCGGKETRTHSRNRLYFQLSLPFFKNVKELHGRNFDIWDKNTKTPKSNCMIFFTMKTLQESITRKCALKDIPPITVERTRIS